MIDKLIIFSIRQKYVVGFFILLILGWGSYSVYKLPIDAIPDITNNQVLIITQNPNLSAYEIEKFVSSPIELAMANIPGLVEMRSVSRFSLSNVTLIFEDDMDVYKARQMVFERLLQLKNDMPPEFGNPTLAPISTGLGEIYQYVIKTEDLKDTSFSPMEIRTVQDWLVRKRLLSSPGIADISSFGGFVKEYQAKVKPELLKATGVTMDELFQALNNGTNNTGGTYIENEETALVVRGVGLAKNLEDIGDIVIKNNGNVPVTVDDVAEVSFGSSVRYGAMTRNGEEVVGGIILMRKGENATNVIKALKLKLKEVQKALPEGLEIAPFLDREEFVSRAIKTVVTNLVEGCIIVLLVLILILGDWRAALLSASVIPLSMLIAVSLMNQFGVLGNLMSLGAIDFGMLVDSAIIVVEAVVLELTLASKEYNSRFLSIFQKEEIITNAAIKVKKSVVYGGLIILIVYVPIMTLTGIEGKMFMPMAVTVSFAIFGALLLSLTYVPMMCTLFIKPHDHHGFLEGFADKLVNTLFTAYEPLLNLALRKKWWVIAISAVLLFLGLYSFSKIGGEFIPKIDEGDYSVEIRLPVGTSLTQSTRIAKKISVHLLEEYSAEVKNVVCKIGTSEIPTDPMPMEAMDLIIGLHPIKSWNKVHEKKELTEKIAEILDQYPGITYSIMQPIENRFNDMLSGAKTDIVVKVFGDDLDILISKGNQIANILQRVQGAKDVQVQKLGGLPQISIVYDRKRMQYFGISITQVNDVLQTAFAGKKAGTIYDGEKRYDLSVRLASEDRKSIDDIRNLSVVDKDGNVIPLKEIASISVEKGPAEISRENGERRINIGCNVRGRDVESLVNEAKGLIENEVKLSTGYRIDYGGQFENLTRAKGRLSIVLPIALLVIFGLLYATFGTIKDSVIIFSAVPLAAVGGIFSLLLRGMVFSISAGVGFIALFGVAVLNGILLIGHFKLLEEQGVYNIYHKVKLGIKEKFRPILLTSAVAAFGFLPMALSHGAGAEVQKPLATVVVGGLLSATILTLVVLPIIYVLANSKKQDTFEN